MTAGIVAMIVIAVVIALLVHKVDITATFRYDHNPFRRWCTRCGQQQDLHARDAHDEHGWWEPMQMIHNPNCECHDHCPPQCRPRPTPEKELTHEHKKTDI